VAWFVSGMPNVSPARLVGKPGTITCGLIVPKWGGSGGWWRNCLVRAVWGLREVGQ
jgi:hypothetical protein